VGMQGQVVWGGVETILSGVWGQSK